MKVLLLQGAMAGPTIAGLVWLALVRWPLVRRLGGGLVAVASLGASSVVFWFAYRGDPPAWRSFAPDLLGSTVVVAAELAVLLVALRSDTERRGVAATTVVALGVATSAVVAAGFSQSLATHSLLLPIPTVAAAAAALSGRGRRDARGLLGLAVGDAVALVGLSIVYARTDTAAISASTGLGVGLLLGAAAARAGALPGIATWRLAATGGPGSILSVALRGQGMVLATMAGVSMAAGERMLPLAIAAAAVMLVAGAVTLFAATPWSTVAGVTGTAFGLPFLALGLGGTLGVRSFIVLVPALLLAGGAAALLVAQDPEPAAPRRRKTPEEAEEEGPPATDAPPEEPVAVSARRPATSRSAAKPARKSAAKPARKTAAKPARKSATKKTAAPRTRRPAKPDEPPDETGRSIPALIRRRKVTERRDAMPSEAAPVSEAGPAPEVPAPPPRKPPRGDRPVRAGWAWIAAASMGVAAGSLLGMPPGGGFPGAWLALSVAVARTESTAGWLLVAGGGAVGLALAMFAVPGLVRSARPRALPAIAGALAAGALLYAGLQPVRLGVGWWIRIETALRLPEVLPSAGAPGLPAVGGRSMLLAAAVPLALVLLVVALGRGLRDADRAWVPFAGPRRARRSPTGARTLAYRMAAPLVPVGRAVERLRGVGVGFAVAAAFEVAALLVAARLIVLTARAGFL